MKLKRRAWIWPAITDSWIPNFGNRARSSLICEEARASASSSQFPQLCGIKKPIAQSDNWFALTIQIIAYVKLNLDLLINILLCMLRIASIEVHSSKDCFLIPI